MPWDEKENEIRHRLKNPDLYSECRSKDITEGVRIIYCKRKDADKWEAQALRFDKKKFSVEKAKEWFEKHKDSFSESIIPDKTLLESNLIYPERISDHFIESAYVELDEKNDKWLVTPLKFGKSKRPPHFVYTKEAIESNLHLFDGAKVFINSTAELNGHKADPNQKVVRDMIGYLSEPYIADDGVRATLSILPSAEWFKKNLIYLNKNNKLDFYQLSIEAYGIAELKEYQGERLPHAKNFTSLSVDVVPQGAMGGQFDRLLESLPFNNNNNNGVDMSALKQRLIALFTIIAPKFLESNNVDWLKVDENELFTKLLEADKPQDRLHLPDGFKITNKDAVNILDKTILKLIEGEPKENKGEPKHESNDNTFKVTLENTQKKIDELKLKFCSNFLESQLANSGLPDPLQQNVRKIFQGKIFDESELINHIKDTKDTYAKLFQTVPNRLFVEAGQDRLDKIKAGLLGMFLDGGVKPPTGDERKALLKGLPAMTSFKEAYVMLTGDEKVTGMKPKDLRFTEAIDTTQFDQVVADVMHQALVREYNLLGLDTWKAFADIVPITDFRTQHRMRVGGYGLIPTVAEKGSYAPLTSPTDEEATYTPNKKGGTEEITLEMIRNDDVGSIRRIPNRLARACAYTLHYQIYYTMLRPQGAYTIYDGVSLYNASHPIATGVTHSNTGTTAITTGLDLARVAMRKFPEKDSNVPIGIRAGYVLVPAELEGTAYGLVTASYGNYNDTPTLLQTQGLKVIVVPVWSDANDYAVVANPADVRGIEVGFLDGKQEPELFVSDLPNTGSWFTNDSITYKVRHIWGVAITDWRAFYGQTVA